MSEQLTKLRNELEALEPYPWERLEAWITGASVVIHHQFEAHAARFEKIAVEPPVPFVALHSNMTPEEFDLQEATFNANIRYNLNQVKIRLLAFLDQLIALSATTYSGVDDAISQVKKMCEGFPEYARQVTSPYRDRKPLPILNEYDVQHHIHALLRLYFDDVRDEEPTPKFAGAWARMDFQIPDIRTILELKMVRENHNELGKELATDCFQYEGREDCDTLIFYVYDPKRQLKNGVGIKKDILARYKGRLAVEVIING